MSDEKLDASQVEAMMVSKLVHIYTAAQTIREQLEPLMKTFGLLKPNGALDTDRVLKVMERAQGKP